MSRQAPAIVWELACTMMRDLSGYKGYPKPIDSPGEHHFIRAFQESVISVEHAKAVIDSFDQEFPTVLHIRETAHQLRVRFEPDPLKTKEWEKRYGPPQAFEVSATLPKGREDDRMWGQIMGFLRTTKFDGHGDIQRVHIGRCWQIAKHLGYKMNSYQQEEINAYERIYPASKERLPAKPVPIIQADIDNLKTESAVAVEEKPEDPDRWN